VAESVLRLLLLGMAARSGFIKRYCPKIAAAFNCGVRAKNHAASFDALYPLLEHRQDLLVQAGAAQSTELLSDKACVSL
jgi:hypothetical protein